MGGLLRRAATDIKGLLLNLRYIHGRMLRENVGPTW